MGAHVATASPSWGASMRILPATPTSVSATSAARRSAAPGGFALDEGTAARPGASANPAAAIHSVDALLALQGVEDAGERRRQLVRRGRGALELLDTLKVEILAGGIGLDTLRRLEVTLAKLSERSGDPRLDEVLDAIGVRVAVELAKRKPQTAVAA